LALCFDTSAGLGRSPYPGKIKKIKWIAQSNQELMVELVIAVAES
jgi:hypothetical protein